MRVFTVGLMLLGISIYVNANHKPVRKTLVHKIGDTPVRIISEQFGRQKSTVFVHLHGNEETSLTGTRRLLSGKGGLLIQIDNPGKRNIRFRLKGKNYSFDPNRMFSRSGIEQSLRAQGRYSQEARQQVEKFAARLLAQFPTTVETIIALHNNSDGNYSVVSYQPGNERSSDARAVYHNEKLDKDELFFTTDSLLYAELRKAGFNSVWQDNDRAQRDGSLSIYCGEKEIRYLNCETEHGKTARYEHMITYAVDLMHSKRWKNMTAALSDSKPKQEIQDNQSTKRSVAISASTK